jgi:hypothetical protein
MKGAVVEKTSRLKQNVLRIVFACFVLSVLSAREASAQGNRDSARIISLASAVCRDNQLSVRNVGEDAAMGGVRRTDYAFTNNSPSPCALKGRPRFEVLSRSGRVVRRGRAATGDDAGNPRDSVTIEPGKTATFYVSYNAGGAGRIGKPCPTYPGVRITAPGNKRGFVLREAIRLCSEIEVSPVGSPSAEQP